MGGEDDMMWREWRNEWMLLVVVIMIMVMTVDDVSLLGLIGMCNNVRAVT